MPNASRRSAPKLLGGAQAPRLIKATAGGRLIKGDAAGHSPVSLFIEAKRPILRNTVKRLLGSRFSLFVERSVSLFTEAQRPYLHPRPPIT